jgi:TRAP transporter TAXI family solute receptor
MKNYLLTTVGVLALLMPLEMKAESRGGGPEVSKPIIRLCTGPDGGNYQLAAQEVTKWLRDRLDVRLVETKGSVENLDRLGAKECDVAPVQDDAFRVYKVKYARSAGDLERAGPLYREYAHLVCNRASGVSRVTDLMSKSHGVAIGPNGSGSSVTWDSWVLADKRYAEAPTFPLAGQRALEKVRLGTEVQCMIFTAALNSSFVRGFVNAAGAEVHLVRANDGDFDNAKDEKGKPIYQYVDIPGGTYPKIQDGAFSSSVRTVAVQAVWVARTEWIEANERPYNWFLEAKTRAEPAIRKIVDQ